MYQHLIKPIFDFIIALFLLLLTSPVIFVLVLLLVISNRGSVLFMQSRPGKNERVFRLYKFKTMRDLFDSKGKLLPDKDRLTTPGKIIRKLSLDELPQLINVLKGDMSLVGPRPLLIQYLPLYNQHQKRRHEVKPGITGWAQVNGRNSISWEDKFKLDIWYVDNISFLTDLRILFLTIYRVIKREGVNSSAAHTYPPYKPHLDLKF